VTVLAVFAHPDDESLACGGTLARLAAEGARVVLLCASRGERGSATGPARDDQLGRARAAELYDAARVLGVADVLLFDHPDGDLRWAQVPELHGEIVMTIERVRPSAVITFGDDGLYWHLDHVGIHERTTTAVQALGDAAPPLYYVTMARGAMRGIVEAAAAHGWTPPLKGFWSLTPDAYGIEAEPPTVVVDVASYVPQKLAAIRCHASQLGAADPFSRLTEPEARRWLGREQFHRAPGGDASARVLEPMSLS
jgi:N-acetyl-1-D-myo-inositol-2-amino-2-deoxy-alpha-D-glucopyranoside deacetylase